MNGWNTETFESLHKDYVKKPYRISNKRDINTQIIGSVRKYLIFNNQFFIFFLFLLNLKLKF
jgi:hypothetical protein